MGPRVVITEPLGSGGHGLALGLFSGSFLGRLGGGRHFQVEGFEDVGVTSGAD